MTFKRKIHKFLLAIKCSFTDSRCIECQKDGCPWWEDMKKSWHRPEVED